MGSRTIAAMRARLAARRIPRLRGRAADHRNAASWWRAVRRSRWGPARVPPVAGLAGIVCFVIIGAGVAAAYLPAERYKATATLVAQPALPASEIDSSSISAVEFILPALPELVKSRAFSTAVARRAGIRLSGVVVTATIDPGTPVVRLSAEAARPRVAQAAARAAADEVVARRLSPILRVEIIDTPTLPTSPVSPRRVVVLVAALILAAIAAIGILFGVEWARRPLARPARSAPGEPYEDACSTVPAAIGERGPHDVAASPSSRRR